MPFWATAGGTGILMVIPESGIPADSPDEVRSSVYDEAYFPAAEQDSEHHWWRVGRDVFASPKRARASTGAP